MIISSIQNEKIKALKRLKDKKHRTLCGEFLVEGEHLVKEAYKSKSLKQIITAKNEYSFFNVPVLYVTKEVIKFLSETKSPQDVIGVCKAFNSPLKAAKKTLILDDVSDPENLGTLIRSAYCFSFDQILLTKNTCEIYNSKVIRGSQGALFHIPIKVLSKKEIILFLKQNKINTYVTLLNAKSEMLSVAFKTPLALILGNEARGVSDEFNLPFANTFKINQNQNFDSLNLSVAGSIIMWYLENVWK